MHTNEKIYLRRSPVFKSKGALRSLALLALMLFSLGAVGIINTSVAAGQTVPAATVVNDPPAAPHQISVFPSRDFVSASGYDPAQGTVTVSVLRKSGPGGELVLVSSAQDVTPSDEGIVEINHPGGACWEVQTPNIRPGDIVRITTAAGVADQTTVANVTAERAVKVNDTTIMIHGTAQNEFGNPLPLAQLEHRLVSAERFGNGRRTLRAPGDGRIAYDAPGSVNWTATYANLSAADLARALASESRVMWLGRTPAAGVELTAFEIGNEIFGGPQAPCSAPSEDGTQGPTPAAGPIPPAPDYTELHEHPVAPRTIAVFPERDFVSVEGYAPGETLTINVLRKVVTSGGAGGDVVSYETVGAARDLAPDEDGLVEVNHPGGACWEARTPDIRPGDIIRVTTSAGVAEQMTVAHVISERPIKIDPVTVVVHGSASDGAGNPLPIDQLEHRLVNANRFGNGRRSLRSSEDGHIAYDSPGSTNWTAVYTDLNAADMAKALASESHGMWIGTQPLLENELTTYEVGPEVFAGTQAPCTVASEPRLSVAANFKGSIRNTPVTVTLTASEPASVIYYTTDGSAPTTFSTKYSAPVRIEATTTLKFFATDPKGTGLESQVFMETYIIDNVAPAAPAAPDLDAASDTGTSDADNLTRASAPVITGTAEPRATVKLFVDDALKATTLADATGAYRVQSSSLADGAHNITVKAFDFVGNASASSAPLNINVDTHAPAAPSAPDLSTAADTGSSNTDNYTRIAAPALRGTAEAGTTVKLLVGNLEKGSAPATSAGAYQITPEALADGVYSVRTKAIDRAGNQSALSAPLNLTVDTANRGVLANPKGGLYGEPLKVTLSGEPGAKIYYTLNGTNPTVSSAVYTAPIDILATRTVKFMSFDAAGNKSVVSTEVYTLAPPAAPSNLTAISPAQGQVTLRWADNAANESVFRIERSTSATTGFTQIGTANANALIYRDATGTRGQTYFYRVRAANTIGASASSNTASVRVR